MKTKPSSLLLALAALACTACGTGSSSVRSEPEARVSHAGQHASAASDQLSFEWMGPSSADWLSWRGPAQNGSSSDTGLPERVDPDRPLWSVPLCGRGTPVIAAGRVYVMGYTGEGPTLREKIVCLDQRDGKVLWEKSYRDFPTDTVYSRYSISSPTIDPETGNVYYQTTSGLVLGC